VELETAYGPIQESNLSASKKVSTLAPRERRKSLLRQVQNLTEVLRGSLDEGCVSFVASPPVRSRRATACVVSYGSAKGGQNHRDAGAGGESARVRQ